MLANYTVPAALKILFPEELPASNANCPRFPHMKVTRLCKYPGLMIEIMAILVKYLNSTIIPYSYHKSQEGSGFQMGLVVTALGCF